MRFLLALALSFVAPLMAQAEDKVTEIRLENGLQLVVIEDHRAPVVVHMVWYRVGSADERAGESGLAHFLEHLMFKGTKTMAPGAFSQIVAAEGGSDNAFTSYDFTAYFQRVAADRLDLVMSMEADRMANLTLTEGDVVTERNVVLEERTTRTDSTPEGLFSEQMQVAQYLNHPYGRPIIGWRHELEALNREAALDFYKRHYAPDNAIVVIAGDVTPAEAERLAREHYGPLKASDHIEGRVRPAEPPQIAERRIILEDNRVGQPYVLRNYMAPSRQSGAQEDAAALVVLARLLGGAGPNSVLGRQLMIEQKVAVSASAYYDATGYDGSTFGVYALPAPGVSLEAVEAALDAALASFLAEGIKDDEFRRIKAQLKASEIYALDSAMGVARRYGTALTTGLTVADQQAWPEVLQAVTPEQVMEAAKSVLNRKQSVTGWLQKETAQ